MDARLEKYKKFQSKSHKILRFRKFLALYGIGIYLWINYLWGLLIEYLRYADEKFDNWFVGLFFDRPPRIYPIVHALDILVMAAFIVCMSYVIYWIYTDTYLKQANGENVRPFKRHMTIAIVLNSVVYGLLTGVTEVYRTYG